MFIKTKCLFGQIVIKFNSEHQTYLLDFNKRVTRESVKNFQLVDEKDNIILQFGRCGDNVFIMDFKFPLSPIQAFAICLTSIERKFGCQ